MVTSYIDMIKDIAGKKSDELFYAIKRILDTEEGKTLFNMLESESGINDFCGDLSPEQLAYAAGKRDMFLLIKKISDIDYDEFLEKKKIFKKDGE